MIDTNWGIDIEGDGILPSSFAGINGFGSIWFIDTEIDKQRPSLLINNPLD